MLGEITESYSGGTPSVANHSYYGGSIPFIRSAEINSINTELYLTEEGLNSSSAKLVEEGDILYALYGATSGEVGISQINGAINQAILAIKPKSKYDPNFIMQWLRRQKNSIISTYLQGGQGNLSGAIVKDLILSVPIEYDEQIRIGAFFKQLDNTIALHQRKVTLLKRLKEAYLTRMLPQNSENIPLLRFADYFDPWEQRKFEDLAESFNYGLNASAMEFDGENKYIRITDIDEYSHRFIQSGLTSPNTDLSNANDYLLKEGDILFARTGASVGKSYQYDPLDGKVYYAGFLIRARIKPEFHSSFIFQNTLTEKYNNFIKITSQRSGQPGVNAQEYANFSIMVPSRGEQVKLGNFFKQLDNAIALHQCKIEKLAKAKKVLLAAMFV